MFICNKTSKVFLSLALTLGLVNIMMVSTVRAASFNTKEMPKYMSSETYNVKTFSDLECKVKDAILQGDNSVMINYTGNEKTNNNRDYLLGVVEKFVGTPGNDYEKTLVKSYSYSSSSYGGLDFSVTYKFEYIETKTQVEQVKSKVKSILSQIITSDMTEGQRIKEINSYICKNVAYDTTYTNYSAYEGLIGSGKTVCQGYALLAYRMLTEAGIEARIIKGNAGGGAHAWNMVKVSGVWYHLDTTWNDPIPDSANRALENYSLLSDAKIGANHTWSKALYPSATKDFVASNDTTIPEIILPVITPVVYTTPKLSVTQIIVVNNAVASDTVKVIGVKKGELVKVYSPNGKTLLGQASGVIGNYALIKLKAQLSEKVRIVKVTVKNGYAKESVAVAKSYAAVSKSKALTVAYVKATKGKLTVKALAKGDIICVYAINPLVTKNAKPIRKIAVGAGKSYLYVNYKTTGSKLYVTRTSMNKLESTAIAIGIK